MFSALKKFDIYPKTIEDFKEKTVIGATISIVSMTIIVFLVISELLLYMSHERIDELYVDTKGDGKIPIYLNISFPAISCDSLSLDIMDVTGEHQLNVEHTIFKSTIDQTGHIIESSAQRLEDVNIEQMAKSVTTDEERRLFELIRKYENRTSDYCGSCYGAETAEAPCCNTCDAVREAYRRKGWAFASADSVEQCAKETLQRKFRSLKKEGCNIHGFVLVNKVAGNFHFAPGKSSQHAHQHIHDSMPFEVDTFNVSHKIHRLGFGEDYPGLKNPLDSADRINTEELGLFQYFIKVVPTIYEFVNGTELSTNQYSVTESFRPRHGNSVMPAVFFIYDLSPIMVHIRENRRSFIHFLTSLCAIVGGVFTVSGLLDAILHNVSRKYKKAH